MNSNVIRFFTLIEISRRPSELIQETYIMSSFIIISRLHFQLHRMYEGFAFLLSSFSHIRTKGGANTYLAMQQWQLL